MFNHQGNRDDSYVQVKEGIFGQVEDMIFIHDKQVAILLLRMFKKQTILTENGYSISFPINQFPVEATNRFRPVVLSTKSYVQKIVRSDLKLKRQSETDLPYPFFSIRPNPWFRF
jgi:hypothetical protein